MRLNILLVIVSTFLTLFVLELFLIFIDYGRPHLSRWDMDGGVRHFESQSGYYVKEAKQLREQAEELAPTKKKKAATHSA